MNQNSTGIFVISLDFELMWGVWDVYSKEQYGKNILGVKKAIPAMLAAFEQYNVKATFATVGFLFAQNKNELIKYLPEIKPTYSNKKFDVYTNEISKVGNDEQDDPYHFGYSLLQQIKTQGHEIGTHTFCHYYCLEQGQSAAAFDADIKAAIKIATDNDVTLNSIVFPRNQINEKYLAVLKANNIKTYRGNPQNWIYKPRNSENENFFPAPFIFRSYHFNIFPVTMKKFFGP